MRRVVVTGMGIVSSIGNSTQEVVASLHRALSQSMETAAVRARLPGLGFEPVLSSPEASAERFRLESVKWARIIHSAGIKVE